MPSSRLKIFSHEESENFTTDPAAAEQVVPRVSSQVQGKYKSGESMDNVETVIAMRKTLSTPPTSNTVSSAVGYAVRKVLSRQEESDWDREEAAELMSRVRSRVAVDDDGAELVLAQDEEDSGNRVIDVAYGLRRIFSSPHRGAEQAPLAAPTPLTRTASDRVHTDDASVESLSSLYLDQVVPSPTPKTRKDGLNTPITLVRRPLSRLMTKNNDNRNDAFKSKQMEEDDTVAESLYSSSSERRQKYASKHPKMRLSKSMLASVLVVIFGISAAVVYLLLNTQKSQVSGEQENSIISNYEDVWSNAYLNESSSSANQTGDVEEINNTTGLSIDEESDTEEKINSTESSTNEDSDSKENLNSTESITNEESDTQETADQDESSYSQMADNLENNTLSPINGITSSSPFIVANADSPISPPATKPAIPPSDPPTSSPTMDTTIVFYVMADAPYSDHEREEVLPNVIDDLPSDAEFLFHLGDLQYQLQDECQEFAYISASDSLRRSKVPVFVVPGDNDMNDCEDHEQGEYYWTQYYSKIDEDWPYSFNVTRWGRLDESLSFVLNRILFFAINIVGGTPYDDSEKVDRHAEHLSMMKSIMNDRSDEYNLVVLLGHAEPSTQHDDLFKGSDGLAAFVQEMGKPFVHFHGDFHWWYEDEGSFGVKNYMRISLDSLITEENEVAPPIRVEIDSSKVYGAVKVSRRKDGWDVYCCSDGWPREDNEVYDDDLNDIDDYLNVDGRI